MRNRSILWLAPALFALLLAPDLQAIRGPVSSAQTAPAVHSAKIWEGRNAEFEVFIRDTPVDHVVEVPIGVTHPKRAYFKPGGLVESIAWKILPPGRPNGYWESY